MSATVAAAGGGIGNDRVIEDDLPTDYEPTPDEINQYAEWIGMDPVADAAVLWVAREGIKAKLPGGWKEVRTADTDEAYYYNFSTKETSWDHPCDNHYRALYKSSLAGAADAAAAAGATAARLGILPRQKSG